MSRTSNLCALVGAMALVLTGTAAPAQASGEPFSVCNELKPNGVKHWAGGAEQAITAGAVTVPVIGNVRVYERVYFKSVGAGTSYQSTYVFSGMADACDGPFAGQRVYGNDPVKFGIANFDFSDASMTVYRAKSGALTAFESHGAINQKRKSIYSQASITTNETRTPNKAGAYNFFTLSGGDRAAIYWSPSTPASGIQGIILNKWGSLGYENGFLGFPVTDELNGQRGGKLNHFQGGSIFWHPNAGAHEVHGSIRDTYARTGWEGGRLGYPTSDEFAIAGGRRTNFEFGCYIEWKQGSSENGNGTRAVCPTGQVRF